MQFFLFLTVVVLTNTFEHNNSLRTIEAQIVQKLKNNEARPKFTGSYKKKACKSAKKYIVISQVQNEILNQKKFHRKWVWGDAKTFKSYFLETIFMSKLWDTRGSNSGRFLSTDLKFDTFIAK